MKHFLTAALIATMAFPLGAEEISLNCRIIGSLGERLNTECNGFTLFINTENWAAARRDHASVCAVGHIYSDLNWLNNNLQLLAIDDSYVMWLESHEPNPPAIMMASLLLLDRNSLRLQESYISPDDFSNYDDDGYGYNPQQTPYQCIRGI